MDDLLNKIKTCIGTKYGAQKKLADYLGIHPNVITNWMNGSNKSYRKHIDKIAEYFNVSVEWLKGETDIKKEPALPEEIELSELRKQAYALLENVSEEKLAKRMAALEALFDD